MSSVLVVVAYLLSLPQQEVSVELRERSKDLATALLATELQADALLLLTDVDAVYTNWDTREAQPIKRITSQQLRNYSFAPGSMQPKVEAACRFVEVTKGMAGIGKLEDAAEILGGDRGTIIRPE